MSDITYQRRVELTVDEQLKRAEANQLFRDGDIAAAVVAYEAALATAVLDENRLPLLSNIGFCHLKLSAPEAGAKYTVQHELDAARARLLEGLALGAACFSAPVLGAKVAGRLLEVCRRAGDAAGERAAIAECRFYVSAAGERGLKPPALDLPKPPEPGAVTALLMAIGQCAEADEEDLPAVRAALREASGEALDEHRMSALCLSVHISCLRPALQTALVQAILDEGAPADARHEAGGTALMLAANNGRVDLCTILLDAGASASAVDGEGRTALHALCIDLPLAEERAAEGLACDPVAVCTLLLKRGTPAEACTADGCTAMTFCEKSRGEHACAEAVALLLEDWLSSKTLAVTRL